MDKICAVIDCQGFQFKDRFVPREIAIVSEFISQYQELNPQMNWRELSDDDQAVVLHSTKFKHGLHYCPFNPIEHSFVYPSSDVDKLITQWYELIATEERPYLAYKNTQMGNILKVLGIPNFDLDIPELKFPPYRDLQEKFSDNYLCAYHKKPFKNSNIKLICAYRKANHLYRQLEEMKLNMDWCNE